MGRHAPTKTLEDACDPRRILFIERAEQRPIRCVTRMLTFVIVGGGPTGVELAGTIAELAHTTCAMTFVPSTPERSDYTHRAGNRLLPSFSEDLPYMLARL